MRPIRTAFHVGVTFFMLTCMQICSPRARADEPANRQIWRFVSGTGTIIYLTAGVGLPLLEDGKRGVSHSLRAADALGTSVLLSDGIKSLANEKRPDNNEHDSFPSGHATAAFSIATVESGLHPKQALYWYSGAALIAISRVALHRHTVGDTLAGAALGYGISRLELSSRRGLVLAPIILPEQHIYGLSFSKSF
jgi:membrane-associated phospholipid phosphatase